MRRLLGLSYLLLAVGFACIAQQERVSAFWQSRDSNYNVAISGGGGGYTGPGDIVAFTHFYALRAYSAAAAAGTVAAFQACDSGGANTQDIHVLTNGSIDMSAITTYSGLHSGIWGCKWYDQVVGPTSFLGPSVTTTNPVPLSLSPQFGFGAFSRTSGIYWNSAGAGSGAVAISQPYSLYMVAYNSTNADGGMGLQFTGVDVRFGFRSNCGTECDYATMYSGGAQLDPSGVTHGNWHTLQGVFNGATSVMQADGNGGLAVGGNAGSTNVTQVVIGVSNETAGCTCYTTEVGWISGPTTLNSGVVSNQHIFWGTM